MEISPAKSARNPDRFLWYFLLLALANLMWAAQGTAVKILGRHIGPITITFLPFYITTLLLIPLLVQARRRNPLSVRPTWRDWRQFVAAGVAGQVLAKLDWQSWTAFAFLAIFMYGVSMLLFFHVLQHLEVTVASMSLYLVPVFGVLLAAGILGERLSSLALIGAAIVLVSTVLVMKYENAP